MGAYLSQPKTEKESTDESNNYLSVGASSMQGWRNSQEVRFFSLEINVIFCKVLRITINFNSFCYL